MLECQKISGIKQTVGKIDKEWKTAAKYAKIVNPKICNGKGEDWKNPQKFDNWFEDVLDWARLQKMDIRKTTALERIGCLLDDGPKIWYRQYKEKTPQKEWNIHAFILMLSTKLIPTTAADKL